MGKRTLSEVVSESDEAFALLILKNNAKAWPLNYQLMMVRKSNEGGNGEEQCRDTDDGSQSVGSEESKKGNTIYTTVRKTKTSHRLGWTNEGLEQFNDYCRRVREDRKTEEGQNMEEELLEMYQSLNEGSVKKKTKIVEEEVATSNDWDTFVDKSNREHNIITNQVVSVTEETNVNEDEYEGEGEGEGTDSDEGQE